MNAIEQHFFDTISFIGKSEYVAKPLSDLCENNENIRPAVLLSVVVCSNKKGFVDIAAILANKYNCKLSPDATAAIKSRRPYEACRLFAAKSLQHTL